MNENENVGFDDFEDALFGSDYQFGDEDGETYDDNDTDTTEDDDVMDDSAEAEEDDSDADDDDASPDGEEEPDEEDSEEADKEDGEGKDGAESDTMTFTIKVNKEEKQVGLEEMTALAQKGADYDRVKKQYTDSQQAIQDLKKQYEVLDLVAEKFGKTPEELAELLYLSLRKNEGASEDLAKEELKRAKVEKERDTLKTQKAQAEEEKDTAENRAQREIEAFQNDYPDVKLTDELISKLTPDIQKGKSLSTAYRNYEKAQSEAKIKELEQKLAAKEQNDKNKKRSPGSQKDSGGRRSRSDFDDFERALFG